MTDQFDEQNVELNDDETEVVEAAHDPKNAEAQSVTSVDKATEVTKSAPARKGDKKNSEKMEKGEKAEGGEAMAKEGYDFNEDLDALISEEATLSEAFKGKAAVIFEAAISSKIKEEVERLEEQYESNLQEEISLFKNDLVEKVDGYLNLVVETWMEENKLAIQNGLRTEIAEQFMDKLKDLFTESYIEVPDSKVDLVDDLAESVSKLEEKLNKQTDRMIRMAEELESYQISEVLSEHASDLADTEAEKLFKLAEDLEFIDIESYSQKVKTIKEAYFKKQIAKTSIEESLVEDESDEADLDVSNQMASYINALRKTIK